MKKILIILVAVISITLVAFLGWYFLVGDQETPFGEVVKNSLPFGSGDSVPVPSRPPDIDGQTTDNQQPIIDEFGSPTANLFRISDTPVAGAVVLNRNASTTIVRYVDRATGHIYDADLTTLVKTKVANQTLPKVYEAYFRPDGNAVVLRFLKDDSDVVENITLTLTPPKATLISTSSPQATDGLHTASSTTLRGDIGSIVVPSSGNTLFYTLRDTSSVVSSAFNGTSIKTLITSPFRDWGLAMTGGSLILHTKASANVPGYAYTLNGGSLKKILGPLNGLSVLPNVSGNRVLYSYASNNTISLFIKNLQNEATTEILPPTLAEKCVWSTRNSDSLICGVPVDNPGGGEPDNWYGGLTHFSDRIWFFDTDTGIAQVLAEPEDSLDIKMDVVKPKLSPNEDYLIFTNKTDLSLWVLKLEQL